MVLPLACEGDAKRMLITRLDEQLRTLCKSLPSVHFYAEGVILRGYLCVFLSFRADFSDFGRTCPVSQGRQERFSGHKEVGKPKEREDLPGIFGKAAIACFAVIPLAFDDLEGMFDLGAHTRTFFVSLFL